MTAGRFNKVRRMADGIKATVSKTYRDGNKRPTVDVTIEGVELRLHPEDVEGFLAWAEARIIDTATRPKISSPGENFPG